MSQPKPLSEISEKRRLLIAQALFRFFSGMDQSHVANHKWLETHGFYRGDDVLRIRALHASEQADEDGKSHEI